MLLLVSHFVFCECNCVVLFRLYIQFYGDYSSCVDSSSVDFFEIKSSVHYTQTPEWLITTGGLGSFLQGSARGYSKTFRIKR